MIAALLAVLAMLTVRDRFNDPDMWWHLRTGQVIWDTHTIPREDLFSWTALHVPWVPHEWLAQTIIYGAYHLAGYGGLMLYMVAITSAILIAGYALCSLYSGNAKVAFVGALTIWLFATSGMAVRPQILGYLFLVLELLIIHAGRTLHRRWFLLLPPLFAVWVDCHGSFTLGFAVAVLYLPSAFLTFRAGGLSSTAWDRPVRRLYGWTVAASAVAMFLNPVGYKQVLYPLEALFHLTVNVSAIQEWRPLDFTTARGIAVLVVVAVLLLLILCQRANLFLEELLLVAAGVWLAASHQRMTFVFGILVAPILSRLLAPLWDNYSLASDRPLANSVLMAASLVVLYAAFPNDANLAKQVVKGNPTGAVAYLHTHPLTGHMLNEWVDGGYLIWAAREHPVFIDGRGDMYSQNGVYNDFAGWAMIQSDPRDLLNKYKVDFCVLANGSAMSHVMSLMPEWRRVFSDDKSIIFVRTP
jgi:hypothetical protein